MADAPITPSDVLRSQVFGNKVLNYLYGHSALLDNPFVREAGEVNWSHGGDTVTFPRVNSALVASDLPINSDITAVDATEITVDSDTATLINKIVAVKINEATYEDVVQAVAGMPSDFFDEVASAVGSLLKDVIDKALVTEAVTAPAGFTNTTAATITIDSVVNTRLKFGDRINDPAMLVVHSKVYADLLKLTAVSSWNTWGGSPVAVFGQVGQLSGMPVVVSDNVTVVAGAPNTYKNIIVRPGGLIFGFKRRMGYRVVPKDNGFDRHEFSTRFFAKRLSPNTLSGTGILVTQ